MLRNVVQSEIYDRITAAVDRGCVRPLLDDLCSNLGLCSAAYLGVGIPGQAPDLPFASVTYSSDWVLHYIEKNYLAIDPVLREGQRSILAVDWNEFQIGTPDLVRFFGEAHDAGLGCQGLTIPVRGRHGESALFSVTCDMGTSDWRSYKRQYLPDFQMIAVLFHDLILRSEGFPPKCVSLNSKETSCLQWAARGKSFEDIADILGMSARSVRFHLDMARHKLSAINITHAVARALTQQLIGPPD
jgi:DNA-binding CsgD family transcriptional regulator